jgi:hypothetical protein
MSDYIERTNQGQVFSGSDVNIFGMLALASAIRMYVNTGGRIKASRNHSVKNMLAATKVYTGITFKRTELLQAAEALTNDADRLKRLPRQDTRA